MQMFLETFFALSIMQESFVAMLCPALGNIGYIYFLSGKSGLCPANLDFFRQIWTKSHNCVSHHLHFDFITWPPLPIESKPWVFTLHCQGSFPEGLGDMVTNDWYIKAQDIDVWCVETK